MATTPDEDSKFVIMESRRPALRYWTILSVLIFFAPLASDLAFDEPVRPIRMLLGGVVLTTFLIIALWPRARLATIDPDGVTMRKGRRRLKWSDVDHVEVGRANHFARTYRWLWGGDRLVRFVPTADTDRDLHPHAQFANRMWKSPFVIMTFMSAETPESIITACKMYSDVPVHYLDET